MTTAIEISTKICKRCNQELELEFFPLESRCKMGRRPECFVCYSEKRKVEYQNNKEKIRNYKLIKAYGISLEEYNEVLKFQNGGCAICGSTPKEQCGDDRSLAVDHNHQTGELRGLLCRDCNIGLGNFKDSFSTLFNAAIYINNAKLEIV